MKRIWISIVFILVTAQVLLFAGCNSDARKASVDISTTISTEASDINKAVILETVADIFSDIDIKSERITQAIYNQPVEIIEEKGEWTRVKVVDDSIGWIKSKFLDRDILSIQADKYEYKVVITAKEKSVSSQAKNGLTLKEVVMGTVFYSNYKTEDAYEVNLPGNIKGWINKTGTIEVPLERKIAETSAEDFTATLAKFKGTNYLIGGVSSWGIDSSGLTYICSRINGINLPRNIKEQFNIGEKISLDGIKNGDLIFFYNDKNSKEISEVAVYIEEGQFIYSSKDKGYVLYASLDSINFIERIAGIRRIF